MPYVSWGLLILILAIRPSREEVFFVIGEIETTGIQCSPWFPKFRGYGIVNSHQVGSCRKCTFHLNLGESEPSGRQNMATAQDGSSNGHEIRHCVVTIADQLSTE